MGNRLEGVRAARFLLASAVGLICLTSPADSVAAHGNDAAIQATSFTVAASQIDARLVPCPAGTRVVGGGVNGLDAVNGGGHVEVSGPVDGSQMTVNTADGDVATAWYGVVGANGAGSA